MWELNSQLLQLKYILLTAGPSLQPWTDSFHKPLSPTNILSESLRIMWWLLSTVNLIRSRITQEINWGRKTHPHGQHYSLAWDPGLYKKEEVSWALRTYHTLLPDCKHKVTRSLKLLPLWHPHQRHCNWKNLVSLTCFYQNIVSQPLRGVCRKSFPFFTR